MERTVLLGFSQGGAMALDSGCGLPLAGVISCSGYPHPNWEPADQHPPVLVMHGRQDTIVPATAMDAITARLRSNRCETLSFDNGHTIPEEMVQPMLTFLKRVLKGP
jgi:phospholipase/carboxylesterase